MSTSPGASKPIDQLPADRWPRRIAIIMDGNGRWAERQGMVRALGHQRGVGVVHDIVDECVRLGRIDHLTLYCLSSENWKRPQPELDFLMRLLEQYLIDERPTIMDRNVRVRMLGRRDSLPQFVLDEIDKTIEMSSGNTGMGLNLAINYGGRAELVDATRKLAEEVRAGGLAPEDISEATLASRLYTAGAPDPDLLIRTAGEMRISNFLLWQLSYSEIWITDVCWPEFSESHLQQAICDYAARKRRFGGLDGDDLKAEF